MTKRNEIAQMGRDEHEFREARRKEKRDRRRGKKQQKHPKVSIREKRSGHLRGAELDHAAMISAAPSGETREGTDG